jgi:uncharacterized cupredoxin-like copper-binding protein
MTRTPSRIRVRSAAAIALALATLAVAGCGSDEQAAKAAGPHTAHAAETTTTAMPTTTTAPVPHEGDLAVIADDYRFDDLPAVIAAGTHTVRFENRGSETHELFLFRNPDGLTLEEIAELGPQGAPQAVELAGLVIVGPGQAADPVEVDLAPGEYEVACFIPTPTDGRAHFEHGMHARITVV